MNRFKTAIGIVCVLGVFAPTAAAEEKRCIGRIIIIGNTYTPAWFIHNVTWFHTGHPFLYPELRLAERNLAMCGRFLIDPQKGIRPTVRTLKKNDRGPVVDIVITVHERPWNASWPAGVDWTAIQLARAWNQHRYWAGILAEVVWDSLSDHWRDPTEAARLIHHGFNEILRP